VRFNAGESVTLIYCPAIGLPSWAERNLRVRGAIATGTVGGAAVPVAIGEANGASGDAPGEAVLVAIA
jgi:hypothetical protein